MELFLFFAGTVTLIFSIKKEVRDLIKSNQEAIDNQKEVIALMSEIHEQLKDDLITSEVIFHTYMKKVDRHEYDLGVIERHIGLRKET